MSKYKKSTFKTSFKNAFHGLRLIWKSEKNFKVHTVIGILVLILAVLLGFDGDELGILVLTIGLVLVSEIFNTALEFGLDAVFKNKYSKLVGMAKDVSAAAVTVSAIISLIVGIFLFVHNLFD